MELSNFIKYEDTTTLRKVGQVSFRRGWGHHIPVCLIGLAVF
jgi:hypothetical protein